MKRVSYKLEDVQIISQMLNEISVRGVTLDQSRFIAAIAGIIDEKNLGIEEIPDGNGMDAKGGA